MKIDLADLAIDAADEIQRVKLKKTTDLKSTRELSKLIKDSLIKDSFKQTRWDYLTIFSKAYFSTYSIDLSKLNYKNSKQYIETISKKLESPSNLENKELEKLLDFCVNLSDYSAVHKEEIDEWTTSPRF